MSPDQTNNSDPKRSDLFFYSYAAELERRSSAWSEKNVGETYLVASLHNIESSRRMLMEDAQRMLTLILALFVAAGAAISFAASQNRIPRLEVPLYSAALVLLIILVLLAKLSVQKITAAYEFYVASAVHSALVHRGRGLHEAHQWMARVDRLVLDLDEINKGRQLERVDFNANLIEEWIRQTGLKKSANQPNLLQIFRPIFALTGVVAVIGAYLTIVYGLLGLPTIFGIIETGGWEIGSIVAGLTVFTVLAVVGIYASLRWNLRLPALFSKENRRQLFERLNALSRPARRACPCEAGIN